MHYPKTLFLYLLSLFIFSQRCYSRKQTPHTAAGGAGFAVVELFTSEGCSSCPAAERVLAQVHNEYRQNVYVMEFHVDYWNYLGWKDVYSSKAFSGRQQQYAGILQLNSAYTPQAIVNGRSELVGSDKAKLESLINDDLQQSPVTSLELSATLSGSNISIKYSIRNYKGQALNIALVQKKAESDVKRGENSGRKLQHINVVRVFKTITAENNGALNIAVPAGLSAADCTIVAYTQLKNTWEITGAAEVAIK